MKLKKLKKPKKPKKPKKQSKKESPRPSLSPDLMRQIENPPRPWFVANAIGDRRNDFVNKLCKDATEVFNNLPKNKKNKDFVKDKFVDFKMPMTNDAFDDLKKFKRAHKDIKLAKSYTNKYNLTAQSIILKNSIGISAQGIYIDNFIRKKYISPTNYYYILMYSFLTSNELIFEFQKQIISVIRWDPKKRECYISKISKEDQNPFVIEKCKNVVIRDIKDETKEETKSETKSETKEMDFDTNLKNIIKSFHQKGEELKKETTLRSTMPEEKSIGPDDEQLDKEGNELHTDADDNAENEEVIDKCTKMILNLWKTAVTSFTYTRKEVEFIFQQFHDSEELIQKITKRKKMGVGHKLYDSLKKYTFGSKKKIMGCIWWRCSKWWQRYRFRNFWKDRRCVHCCWRLLGEDACL